MASRPQPDTDAPAMAVHLLGVTDFDACLTLQQRLAFELGERAEPAAHLVVCEHPPMISVGRQGSWGHIVSDPDELAVRQLAVRWVARGGGCVVHAPGQLAVYPLIPLRRLSLGVAEFRRRVRCAIAEVAAEWGVTLDSAADGAALRGRHGPLAFLGMAVKNWISRHGFFLNVSPDPFLQRLVRPCAVLNGANGRVAVSSLVEERGRPLRMDQVRESLVRILAERLGFPRTYVYAGQPLLRTPDRMHEVIAHTR